MINQLLLELGSSTSELFCEFLAALRCSQKQVVALLHDGEVDGSDGLHHPTSSQGAPARTGVAKDEPPEYDLLAIEGDTMGFAENDVASRWSAPGLPCWSDVCEHRTVFALSMVASTRRTARKRS